jgi:hypothetical protein
VKECPNSQRTERLFRPVGIEATKRPMCEQGAKNSLV